MARKDPMNHYCPQCEDEARAAGGCYSHLEDYTCGRCKDGYCTHFMKSNGPEYVCWVCGSEKLEPLFQSLCEKWHNEAGFHSNSNYYNSHPSYLALLAIGKPIIPLIIKDIKAGPRGHWFHAIEHILGDGPEIPEEHRGRIRIMENIYLDWLAERGYK